MFVINPIGDPFDITSSVGSLADIDRLTSITATPGDTLILTSDGVIETLAFSRSRAIINRSGGTNDLSFASTGVGVRVAPASIGATFHVEGTGIWNVPNAAAAAWDLQCGGTPYLRFVTSAGARNLELGSGGAMKLVPTSVRWDGHFLPTDLSSNFDIGGTPANQWRNGYFAGTLYADGGVQAIATATQAAGLLLRASAVQNATVSVQDSLSNNLFAIDVDNSNVTFNVDEVIIKDGTRTDLVFAAGGSFAYPHIQIYDGTTPGALAWEMGSSGGTNEEYLLGYDYLFSQTSPTGGALTIAATGGVGDHYRVDVVNGVGEVQLKTVHGADVNSGNLIARIRLHARLSSIPGPVFEVAYGGASSWATPLTAVGVDEYVRFGLGTPDAEPTTTLWALGIGGQSFQARDAHIVSDTYGLMLGAGTAGGAGDVRLAYNGTNTTLQNLTGTGYLALISMGMKADTFVNAYESSTPGAFNALASGTSRPGMYIHTGGSTAEVLLASNSGGYAYGSMYGWYLIQDESATGDLFLKAGNGGAPVACLRYYRGSQSIAIGGDSFAAGGFNKSIYGHGQINAQLGGWFNYSQATGANGGDFVVSSVSKTYMLYVSAVNDSVGFGKAATGAAIMEYDSGNAALNKSGTYVLCNAVAANLIDWFGSAAYHSSSAGIYGFGWIQEGVNAGDMWFFRKDGGAADDATVFYAKRSNGYVGIGAGWVWNAPPLYQLDVAGTGRFSDDLHILADNTYVYWGAADDCSIGYDNVNMVINSAAVGTGVILTNSLPYGSCYQHDTATTISVGASGTWYDVTGMTVGLLSGCTFSDPSITCTYAGKYKVDWSISLHMAGGANLEIEGGVEVNGTISTQTTAHGKSVTAADTYCVGGTGIVTVAAGQTINLAILNETDANDVVIDHANLSVMRVGA